ncbi:hypothetical protein [Streptomyces olivochromogenes]|uniref:Secreted protein n=1 Tax=Streptomyces olivochromogenes TaxID=1963 RepID=A0A250VSE8_STROL|nr:hypothetical protein [Streptomyces olivochromogenes]GAX57019.1 hypothetical protein SO3561_08589 [Streptomyces olivochromogenes]
MTDEQPMSEQPVQEPVQEPAPESVAPESIAPVKKPKKPKKPRKPLRRGRVAAVAGSVLLVAAVLGGAGYTVVTVQDADRAPGAPSWTFPVPVPNDAKTAKTASGLAAMLVPYGTEGWSRGPDIGEFGSDTSLSGPEATALRKEALRDLPRSQRRELEKRIDKQHTKGIAMRSYLSTSSGFNSTLYADSGFTMSVELAQIEDKAAVKGMSTFQNEFFAALKIFRKGPEIKGYKNAKCFLPPKDKDEKLDMMVCSAYQGDVLVSATAHGAKPLDTKGVAMLLREQLDRIAEPGEAA